MIGVILAGGRSSRFGGGPKAEGILQGQSLLSHVAGRIRPQVDALWLNAPDRFGLDLPLCPDIAGGQPGPLAGVHSALKLAQDHGATHVVTVPVDTPFLPRDLVARLSDTGRTGRISCAASPANHGALLQPLIAIWPVETITALEAYMAMGQARVQPFLKAQAAKVVSFSDTPHDPFMNINTPEELARAEGVVQA